MSSMTSIHGDLTSQSAAITGERRAVKPFRRDRNELRYGVVLISYRARSTSGSGSGLLGVGGKATSAAGGLGRRSGRGKLWVRKC